MKQKINNQSPSEQKTKRVAATTKTQKKTFIIAFKPSKKGKPWKREMNGIVHHAKNFSRLTKR